MGYTIEYNYKLKMPKVHFEMPAQTEVQTEVTEVQTDIAKLQPLIDAIKAEQRLLQEERVRERIARMKAP